MPFSIEECRAEARDLSTADLRKAVEALHVEVADLDFKPGKTQDEVERREQIMATIATFDGELERRHPTQRAVTVQGPDASQHRTASVKGYELRSPSQGKKYRDLFGDRAGYQWPDKDVSFWEALYSGRMHPGLTTRAMTEGNPSSGGFLVPGEQSERIHNVALENEIVLPRCFVVPMRTDSIKLPAMEIGNHATNLMGGFTASWKGEASTLTENSPKARGMELTAKKLVGYIRFSSELAADVPGGFGQIETLCGKGLGWYRDSAFLTGTGAGEPLGILNAPCLVTVPKEGGQTNDTILYENLIRMMARMYAGSFANSVWICHQSTIPQLLSLSIAVGTAGSFIPVMSQTNGEFSILTRPVIFTEKTEKLGDLGDIMLADLSQFVAGVREEMRVESSIHALFNTDEIVTRLIARLDGQPLWGEALTLADGVTQVSPFVTLAAR